MQTLEQRTTALEKANRVRVVRASLKRNVSQMTRPTACAFVAEAIEENPEELRTMACADLLRAVPRLGSRKTLDVMKAAGVPWSAKLGGLTVRQRLALRAQLEMRA